MQNVHFLKRRKLFEKGWEPNSCSDTISLTEMVKKTTCIICFEPHAYIYNKKCDCDEGGGGQ